MEQNRLYIHRKTDMNLDQFLYYVLNSLNSYIKNYKKLPEAFRFDYDDYLDILNNRSNILMFENNTAYILTIKIKI